MNVPIDEEKEPVATVSDLRRWLFNQGASTVLLFALAVGCWRAVPMVLESYEKIEAKHIGDVKEIQALHQTQLKELAETFKAERITEREQAKETISAMRELTAEIRQARK